MKLEEIEAMLEAATPGPWEWRNNKSGDPYLLESLHKEPNKFAEIGYCHPDVLRISQYSVGWDGYDFDIEFNKDEHDASLIAAAPTIIREMVEDNKRLRGSLRRIVEAPLYECTGNDQLGCIELMSNIAVAALKEST